ncbi:MAG: hypothetical protein HQK77_12755 [Desulfobacterales bacterium]|nr:hypothetical protein [Desulfobacterales bacterium]
MKQNSPDSEHDEKIKELIEKIELLKTKQPEIELLFMDSGVNQSSPDSADSENTTPSHTQANAPEANQIRDKQTIPTDIDSENTNNSEAQLKNTPEVNPNAVEQLTNAGQDTPVDKEQELNLLITKLKDLLKLEMSQMQNANEDYLPSDTCYENMEVLGDAIFDFLEKVVEIKSKQKN